MANINNDKSCFKEAVCIDTRRVYDSCSDKDCIEDIRVLFTKCVQELVDDATNVRIKGASVITVFVEMQPIPFNRGFYSVDMTFFFDITLELYTTPISTPQTITGISVFNKKVILYGSEGCIKTFTSSNCENDCTDLTMPEAVVEVSEPVALSAKLCIGLLSDCCDSIFHIPEKICIRFGGEFERVGKKSVYVSLGIFMIVQIVRNTQLLIPAYDFCIPEKECLTTSDSPCDLFEQIEFPVNEFFPPSAVSDSGLKK